MEIKDYVEFMTPSPAISLKGIYEITIEMIGKI